MDRCFYDLVENVQLSNKISRSDMDRLLEKLREDKTVSSAQSLVTILCCGSLLSEETKPSRTALVQEIFKCLDNLNVPVDISHYNGLLRVYWENEHRFSATEFLAQLESKGVQPNRLTYQKLLLCSSANGDIKEANNLFKCMKEKGLTTNQNILDLLIISNSKADELELAIEMLEESMRAKSRPSNLAFYTLCCGFARKSDIDYLCQIIETCKQKNIVMQEEGFIMILQALADSGHGQHIERMEQVMHQYGYFMDDLRKIFSLISLTKQFEASNRAEIINDANFDECKYLAKSLNQMIYGSEFASNLGQKMLLIILKGFINQGVSISEGLDKKLKELCGENETKHLSLLTRLCERKLESNDPKSAPLKDDATENRLSVKELEEFIIEMEGVDMNVKALKLQLIRSVIRSNDHAKVVMLLQKMKDEEFDIIPDIYEEIVEMYAMSGKLEEAMEMLKKARLNHPKFILNRVKLLRIVKYLFAKDRYGDTLRFLQENVPLGDRQKASHEQAELDFAYIHAYWEFLTVMLEKCVDERTIQLPFVFAVALIKEHLIKHNFHELVTEKCPDQSKQQGCVDVIKNQEDVKKNLHVCPTCSISRVDKEHINVADSNILLNTDADVGCKPNLEREKVFPLNSSTMAISSDHVPYSYGQRNLFEQSKTIEWLVVCKRLSEATEMVLDILDQKLIPEPNIFNLFLKEVALNGRTDTLDRISALIPDSLKVDFSFDKYYRSADMASGNVKKHLVKLLRSSRRFKSKEQAENAAKNFCIVGSCWGLKYEPELDGLLKAVGKNYAVWDVYAPLRVLWQHYLIIDNLEEADEIYDNLKENNVDVNDEIVEEIIYEAEKMCSPGICHRYFRYWDECIISEETEIYDCFIKVMLSKRDINSLQAKLKKAITDPVLVRTSNLQWFKSCAEFRGMHVPFIMTSENTEI